MLNLIIAPVRVTYYYYYIFNFLISSPFLYFCHKAEAYTSRTYLKV